MMLDRFVGLAPGLPTAFVFLHEDSLPCFLPLRFAAPSVGIGVLRIVCSAAFLRPGLLCNVGLVFSG